MNNSETDFSTKLENLPQELLAQKRFFPVNKNKQPCIPAWQEPKNQMTAYEAIKATGLIGMDICGHGLNPDYFFVDFDHVLNGDNFIYPDAQKWDNYLGFSETFQERSISKTGKHFLFNPTPNIFPKLNGGRHAIYFDEDKKGKHSPKIELFYRQNRYIALTGDCQPNMQIVSGKEADEFCQQLVNQVSFDNSKIKDTVDAGAETPIDSDISIEEVKKMLAVIDCVKASEADWWKIGAIIHDHFGKNGFELWRAWSATDKDRYTLEECQKQWNYLDKRSELNISRPAKIGSLIHFAKNFGYKPPKNHAPRVGQHGAPMDDTKKIFSDNEIGFYLCQPYNDLGFARRIKKFSEYHIRWLTDDEKWAMYNPAGFWQITSDKNSAILPFVNRLADKLRATATAKEKSKAPIPDCLKTFEGIETNEDIAKKLKSLSTNLSLSKKSNPAIFYLKGERDLLISRTDLDNHISLVNFADCVVDLSDGKTYGHAPDLLLTQQIKFPYRADFHSDLVDKFFEDILPDKDTREAVLLWLGYCLTGDISMQCAHFWTGTGSNGKSTLLDWLLYVFGAYGVKLSVKAIVRSRDSEANAATTHLNPLIGARLAVVDEFEPYHRLNEQIFKALTGDKLISIRQLHHEREVIENKAKLILNGNKLPNLDDSESYAIRRRIRAVDYKQVFSEAKGNILHDLPKQLRDPKACIALMSILVKKAIEWYKTGKLTETAAMTTAKNDYLNDNDFVEEFISENCSFKQNAVTTRKAFETQLKEAFPCETSPARIRSKDLSALIRTKLESHGVVYAKNNHNHNIFQGVELLGAFPGKPIDKQREAIP